MEKKKHREATHNTHGCTAICAITGFKFRPICLKDHFFSQLYHTGLHGNAVARIPESPHSLHIFVNQFLSCAGSDELCKQIHLITCLGTLAFKALSKSNQTWKGRVEADRWSVSPICASLGLLIASSRTGSVQPLLCFENTVDIK